MYVRRAEDDNAATSMAKWKMEILCKEMVIYSTIWRDAGFRVVPTVRIIGENLKRRLLSLCVSALDASQCVAFVGGLLHLLEVYHIEGGTSGRCDFVTMNPSPTRRRRPTMCRQLCLSYILRETENY